jgi:hypothetical protein
VLGLGIDDDLERFAASLPAARASRIASTVSSGMPVSAPP